MHAIECAQEPAGATLTDAEAAELGEAIARTAACLDAAAHCLLGQLRAFDACHGWARQGALSCAHWLSWRTGIAKSAAREQVRVARQLGALPLIDEALRCGQLSYSKVRAMTRVATASNEATLVELGHQMTAAELEKTCRILRQQLAPPQPARADERRYVRVRQTDDGMVVIEAHLHPDEAARVLAGIDASAEARDRAGGLVAMAERALMGGATAGGPPVEVTLTIDAGTLEGTTPSGFGISRAVARRLCCDAGIVPALVDGEGRPLDVGRKTRTIPTALRRALLLRDGQCRFPGCANRFVDAHHVVHWADGGDTSLENTCLLCRSHHRHVHELGFSIDRGASGELRFLDPRGEPVRATFPALLPPADWGALTHPVDLPRADWDPVDYDACLDALVAVSLPGGQSA